MNGLIHPKLITYGLVFGLVISCPPYSSAQVPASPESGACSLIGDPVVCPGHDPSVAGTVDPYICFHTSTTLPNTTTTLPPNNPTCAPGQFLFNFSVGANFPIGMSYSYATGNLPICAVNPANGYTGLFDQAAAVCTAAYIAAHYNHAGGDAHCMRDQWIQALNIPSASFNYNQNYLIDANCHAIRNSNNQPIVLPSNAVCTKIQETAFVSPISLVWEEGYDIGTELAMVSFPIALGAEPQWYSWHGSAKAPLLVYDPEHSGKIASAAQLFGDWTFGGKTVASLDSNVRPVKWANGYEPLATLDANGDGEVSGKELAPLALWFDENMDGISQSGEVKSLAEVKVNALYFAPDRTDPATKNIYAAKGYSREVDGKVKIGASVDWYAISEQSKYLLLQKVMGLSNMNLDRTKVDAISDVSNSGGTSTTGKLSDGADVTGMWKWESKDASRDFASVEGYLMFVQHEGGRVGGVGVAPGEIKPERGASVYTFSAVPMIGKLAIDKNGKNVFEFESDPSESDKAKVRSTAVLAENGKLLGSTTVTGTLATGKPIKIQYSWEATKVSSHH